MITTRVIPLLLLKGGGLVKTVKFKDSVYIGDPINAVKIFNEKEVDELIFLDIEASKGGGRINFQAISDIASECFMPLCYGGGVRTVDQMKRIFSLGVEKIAINSYIQENPRIIEEAAMIFGSQSVIVSIDVKKIMFGGYAVQSAGKTIKKDPLELARHVCDLGAGEIMLTAIDRDGTMQGYDMELIRTISSAVSIPVIACGGAGSLEDMKRAVDAGAAAAAAGSIFVFYGKNRAVLINYPSREELVSFFSR